MPLHQLYVMLRDCIAGGTPEGSVPPSEFELTAAFNVRQVTGELIAPGASIHGSMISRSIASG
jgi:hypothetical protein